MRAFGLRQQSVSGKVPPPPPTRRRITRWALTGLTVTGGLFVAALLLVAVLVRSLDRPWVKQRVQALARASTGLDVDYGSVSIAPLSRATIEGLVVKTPAEFRAVAPDLLAIGRVEAHWSFGSLLRQGPPIEELSVSDVTLALVVDEHGRTSLDALPEGAPSVPVPLSHRAAKWLSEAPPVRRVNVNRIKLTLLRAQEGHLAERTDLRGLSLSVALTPVANGWRMRAGLGSPALPLDLQVERAESGTATAARAALWLTAAATPSEFSAKLDLRMLEQTLVPALTIDPGLHAEVDARFEAAAGRTMVTLDQTDISEGTATATASIEVPDAGDPTVHHAQGDLDVARVIQWIPKGLLPVTARSAHVHWQIDALVVGPIVRLADGGTLVLDANVSDARASLAPGAIEVREANISLRGQPIPGGVAVRGSLQFADSRVTQGRDRLAVDDLALDFEGRQTAGGDVTGRAGLRFGEAHRQGASPLTARGGRIDLTVDGLHADGADPLAARGNIALSLALASLEARASGQRAMFDRVSLQGRSLLLGHAPYAADVDSGADRFRLYGSEGAPTLDAPAHGVIRLHDVAPDLAEPVASLGAVQATLDLGNVHVSLDATKEKNALDFVLLTAAKSLRLAAPWLPARITTAAPLDQMAATMRSSGRFEGLAGNAPELTENTAIEVERPSFENASARSLSIDLRSKGTANLQTASADLRAKAFAVGGSDQGDEHVAVTVTFDRQRPSLRLGLETDGRAAAKASASLSFDRSRRAVAYELDGAFADLGPLAPFVSKVHGFEGFDLSKLALGFSAHGALLGVVSSAAGDGDFQLEPRPSLTASVEGTADLRVSHFRWARGGTAVAVGEATWHGEMRAAGTRRTLSSHVDADAVHLAVGPYQVDLEGISDEGSATVTGDLRDPESELTARASIRDVRQDAIADYPIGGVAFTLAAERDRDGLVHLTDLKLANGAGATTLAVSGSLDLGARRKRLSLAFQLAQDLEALSRNPARFSGRGNVMLEAKVESPDLSLFRTHVDLKAKDVHWRMPDAGVDVEGANGEIPGTMTFELDKGGTGGLTLLRAEERNPYSMLRFADQHALLSRTSFISIDSVKTPFASIAPLAGNLTVEQNVVSLSQFEMGIRGGSVTGQCALNWDGPRSTLELHVRATGVQSSHGEPFDGNVAVIVAAADRTVEGRAEIVRIGPRHLHDLLDIEDPLRVDPAMNRIRGALAFGYPKRLRLVFDHGFASARLELGGLASLVSLGEMRGIPMGPIVDRFLAPVLDAKKAP